MEPIKPLGEIKVQSSTLLTGLPTALQGKEGHFLAGVGTSGYLRDLEKCKINPKL